jgi:hypothetical protein
VHPAKDEKDVVVETPPEDVDAPEAETETPEKV